MSRWRTFPENRWKPIGALLSGFGEGEGAFGTSYAIATGGAPFLNGRVSANLRISGNQLMHGAGLVARGDEFRTYATFYVVTDDTSPGLYSVRLAAFKHGRLVFLRGLRQSILIPERQVHIALQFFSGEVVGQVTTDLGTSVLNCLLPEPPFPGYCGLIRFYDSPVIADRIHIEEIAMKPILSDDESEVKKQYDFRVFISHSSSDKNTVLKVTEALKKAGVAYWIDHEQITFGDGIVTKIEDGLRRSKFVVVCLSSKFASSGWCRAEYAPILYREFSGDTSRRVIPLSLDGSTDRDSVPLLISDKMRADFTNSASFSLLIDFLKNSD